MNIVRRDLILGLGAMFAATVGAERILAQTASNTSLPLPRKENFESGDFLWPKKPGAFVPYNSGSNNGTQRDEELWIAEKERFLEKIERAPDYFTEQDISNIRRLTYREFYARYAGDQVPGVPGTYSTGAGIYVGHVGILDFDSNSEPWVIEALWGKGVTRKRYDDWIKDRPGEIVWHGRTRQISKEDRSKIAIEGKKYIGRPYDFWNFNLNDAAAFYCSKLVWLCIWRALGFAIDGDENSKRVFWFSPK